MLLALQSVLCVILVVLVGTWLSQSADVLAEKSGLGRTWVGAVLLAGATSLPELATGVSAVVVFNAPDLAAGGIFGSCLFNLLLLVLLDIFMSDDKPLRVYALRWVGCVEMSLPWVLSIPQLWKWVNQFRSKIRLPLVGSKADNSLKSCNCHQ
jgi:hypothetical protein